MLPRRSKVCVCWHPWKTGYSVENLVRNLISHHSIANGREKMRCTGSSWCFGSCCRGRDPRGPVRGKFNLVCIVLDVICLTSGSLVGKNTFRGPGSKRPGGRLRGIFQERNQNTLKGLNIIFPGAGIQPGFRRCRGRPQAISNLLNLFDLRPFGHEVNPISLMN